MQVLNISSRFYRKIRYRKGFLLQKKFISMAGHFGIDKKCEVRAEYTVTALLTAGIRESHHVSV
jgi:hypothetical protein